MTCSRSAEHASAEKKRTGACFCPRTKKAASTRLALLRIERGEEGLRVLLFLEHVRSDITAGEALAELHPMQALVAKRVTVV